MKTFSTLGAVRITSLDLLSKILHPEELKTTSLPLSHSCATLRRLNFRPLTRETSSIGGLVPMDQEPSILPFSASPKLTFPPLLGSNVMNAFSSPVICLEHPLSMYHSFDIDGALRATCNTIN
ncbi:hypothetical protein M5689_019044 [Euphorbia peplus]|nr:hypothetical protein M5689_019044 [Euphorbia peplus]